MNFRYTVASLAAACLPAVAAGQVLDGPFTRPATGNVYYVLEQATYADSVAEAAALGGTLVVVDDADENDWLVDTFMTDDAFYANFPYQFWLGLTKPAGTDAFAWDDGTPVDFTHWIPGEPNEDAPAPAYTLMIGPNILNGEAGQWWDTSDGGISPFSFPPYGIVEVVVPEPAAGLLAAGGLMLVRRRR